MGGFARRGMCNVYVVLFFYLWRVVCQLALIVCVLLGKALWVFY